MQFRRFPYAKTIVSFKNLKRDALFQEIEDVLWQKFLLKIFLQDLLFQYPKKINSPLCLLSAKKK